MKLSIIIVNYNTYALTKQTIDSIIEKKHAFQYEILLVDNASSDGSIERLQLEYNTAISEGILQVLINKANLGFAKANNIGIRIAKGDYILLLNSDTVVNENCLEDCLTQIKNDKNIGALGCKVVLSDGALDHACKRGFPTPKASLYYLLKLYKKDSLKYGQYNALHLPEYQTGEVDCLTGAFMLMPKSVLSNVGLLDEDFFMYGEDIDLCYRIKEAGYKILYYPKAQITHYKGGSSKKKRTKVIYDFHEAMWLFYTKHYYKKYNFLVTLLVYIGIWVKYLLELLKNMLLK
ncbi:glycosyltransferase family 2 protein [Clostridium sp.]|uniref:glycosyltransferase family 2 protein n=1 Tax=Clostridium sp. TaxID=1506 RepID=UPI0028420321|nr:glycosyltransferase family 2 protein [Clostridium sp.]MDR3593440.1 glycosyltransferase family 2 protein [Clostridium sp.]